MNSSLDKMKYIIPIILCVFTFILSYSAFHHNYYATSGVDALSGDNYALSNSGVNPYTPNFIGFTELTDSGVSSDDLRYIYDVLTNFTLYNQNSYKAKVSYVKDSFNMSPEKSIETKYSFKFGINNSDIHTVNVSSNMIKKTIHITIYKGTKEAFDKKFYVYSER